jgi:outer membrane protein
MLMASRRIEPRLQTLWRLVMLTTLSMVVGDNCCWSQTSPTSDLSGLSILEAAQAALTHHPLIASSQAQVEIDRGLKQQASAAFDTTINATVTEARSVIPLTASEQEENALIGVAGASDNADLTVLNAGVTKTYRNGIVLTPTVAVNRSTDNISNPQGVNTANPNLMIVVPLFRGRGSAVVAAQERAAEIEVSASIFDLTQEISLIMFNVASDYWNLAAAQKQVAIAMRAEDRARTDLNNTEALVAGDQLPRANLNEVNANVAQTAATRIAAEQTESAARYQLATDMGMREEDIASRHLMSSDAFPDTSEQSQPLLLNDDTLRAYIAYALQHRSDYLAAGKRIEEQHVNVVADTNRLLPQLNLTGNVGYTGLREGRRLIDGLNSFASNTDGVTASGSIAYSFAPKNDLARGTLHQALAIETQLKAQREQLAHTIGSSVLTALQAVNNADQQRERARAAANYYQKALEGEREKYRLGMASIVDVLTIEGLLTTADGSEVQAEQAYALALTQLRFTTGSFVAPGKTVLTINGESFRLIPQFGRSEPTQMPR